MKRLTTILLLAIILMAPLFSNSSNLQKIYDVNSEEYEAITYLYIAEGRALPSTTGPWSGAELKLMLNRLDKTALDGYSLKIYNWVDERVNGVVAKTVIDENFKFSISGDFGLRATYHTNPEDFNSPDDVANSGTTDYKTQLPMLSIPLETWIGDNIYGYSSFDLGINRTLKAAENKDLDTTVPLGIGFQTNVLLVPPVLLNDLNLNFPYRAFGALGGDWYSFEIGRDKLSWGAGESGNLTLGDQLPYHNQARFTAFTDRFKYTFLMSFFPHSSNYVYTESVADVDYDKEDKPAITTEKDWIDNHFEMRESKNGVSAYIGHRLEWTIAEKLGMSVTESIMYQNASNFDLTVLSPTALFHNFYIRANANSMLAFELDYSPISNLSLYGQFAIDEFKLPGEFSNDGPPSAFGYLIGAKGALPLDNGYLYGSIEYANTDPYLYIRDDGSSYDPYKYGINYVGAIPEFITSENISNYHLMPLGYKYGNDVAVANLNVGYKAFGSWFVEGNARLLLDGCFDIFTRWNNDVAPGSENDPSAPSLAHPDEGNYIKDSNWESRNAVARNLALTLKGGVSLFAGLDITGEVTYITINNYENIEGEKTSDLQLEISAKYSF